MTPKTIAIDFDGVIHSYTSGWTGEVPSDPPVTGAKEFIEEARAQGYRVEVFTCRALTEDGYCGIVDWLKQHGIVVDNITSEKPHAQIYIDDRAWRFDGKWATLLLFVRSKQMPKVWYKNNVPDGT